MMRRKSIGLSCDGSTVSVRGRLHKSLRQWKQINAPQFVLETRIWLQITSFHNTATENIKEQ